jgi:hypothetical protein
MVAMAGYNTLTHSKKMRKYHNQLMHAHAGGVDDRQTWWLAIEGEADGLKSTIRYENRRGPGHTS